MIYLLTSCNTEERIAQNIYIHNSNRNITKKSTTRTILIKKRISIGYKNYEKQCPGLEFRLIPKLISWAGSKSKNLEPEFFDFFDFEPAQLMSFGIKRNSSPGHCFS